MSNTHNPAESIDHYDLDTYECEYCERDLPLSEFSGDSSICMSCETEDRDNEYTAFCHL